MRGGPITCLLAVALAGCGDEREPPPPSRPPPGRGPTATDDECVAATKGELGSPGGLGLGPDVQRRLRAERELVIMRRCTQDGWPAEAARCYAEAQGLRELGRCFLPPPMSDRLTDELQETMRRGLGLPR